MKHTTRFSVGGQTVDVPNDELEQFRTAAAEHGATPDEVKSYRVDGKDVEVPDSQYEQFSAMAKERGATPQPLRRLSFADGSTRDFTMPELSKFLRSKEWREDERYAADREAFREQEAARGLPTEQGSAGWAGTKGAIAGAAQGAVAGANAAASKVLAAIPEAAASVAEAAGNALSGMGNAKNPVGEWLHNSGKGVKDWLNANVKTTAADQLGYTDDLVKLGDIAGDAAGMAVKFAPAAVAGPGYVEAILASDGINAYRDTHDAAIEKGWNEAQANVAGATAGLINYYGGKLLMKSGDVASAWTKNLLGQFLLGGGVAATTMGAQAAGNKAVENTIEGKPFFEGTGGAFAEGLTEGAAFHVLNAAGHGGKAAMEARRETASLKEMRKENLLTVAENGGGEFLDRVTRSEGMEEAIKARKEGKDVSRKMGERADLPDNMSVAERNKVVDAIVGARKEKAEAAKRKIAREDAEIAAQPGDERVAESQMKEADAAAHAERQSELQKTFDKAKPAEAPKTTEEPAPKAEEPPAQKPPAEAPRSAPREEGTTTPPKATEDAEGGKSAENGVVEPSAPVEPPKTPQTPPEKPVSAKKMRTMKHEKVIALPDSWQKYSELQSRLMRTGDKGGIYVESPAGKQIKAEMERMDADGWGDLYRAKMKWAGSDKKTRGEQPPDTLEAFKEWQAAKTGGKPAETTPETPVAESTESAGAKTAEHEAAARREAFRNDPVLQRIDAEYKKAKTDAERNALRDAFEARVKELQRKGLKVPKDAAPTEPPKEEAPKEEAPAEPAPKDEAPKEAETPSSASDAKPARAEAEAEALKPKSKGRKTKAAKADAKKAAKVVENFVSKDGTRKALQQVHHDHEGGVAVATDGRVLIATKHGYDRNAKGDPENPFPSWRQVVPNYDGETYERIERDFDAKSGKSVLKKTKHPVQKVEVDPAAISDTCRKVAALANKIGNKDTIHAALELPDGKVVVMDAAYLRKVADAMAANGITEIKAVDGKSPILAKNADTTIVAMPLRVDGTNPTEADFRKGRGGSGIVIDALTGRILSAPERSDNTAMTSRKWADELKRRIASGKKDATDKARKTALYKAITDAWKNGEKDPRKIYDGYAGEGSFDKLKNASDRELFVELLKLGDKDALAERLAEYEADHFPQFNRWRKDLPREVEKIEKRIAAEDEIDALMGGDKAAEPTGKEPTGKEPGPDTRPQMQDTPLDQRLQDPAFRRWAQKQGVAPTKDHLEMYDRQQAKGAFKVVKRWLRGVKAKFESRPPTDADIGANDRAMITEGDAGVDEAARRAGYNHVAYHGTPFGGWNEYDLSRGGMESGNGRGVISLTSSKPEAEAYSKGDSASEVSDVMFKVNKVLAKIPEKAWKATESIGMDGERFSFDSAAFSDYAEEFTRRTDEFDFDSPAEYRKAERKAERDGYIAAMKSVLSDMKGAMPEHGKLIDEAMRTLDGASAQNPEVKKLYVRIGNPFKADATPQTYGKVAAEAERLIREGRNDGAIIRLDDGTLRYFVKDPTQIKSADAITRDDAGNIIPLSRRFDRTNQDIRYLRNVRGDIIGKWDKAKNEVTLYPGANAETVAHEIGWHATYDYAERLAAQGDRRLLDKLQQYAQNAPAAIKASVLAKYGLAADPRMLLDEVGAARFTAEQAMKIKNEADRRAALKWYGKAWEACRDAYKSMLTKMGFNKTSIDAMNALSPEQAVEFMAKEMAKGKSIGKAAKSGPLDVDAKETATEKYVRKAKDSFNILHWVDDVTGGAFSVHREQKLTHGAKQRAFNKAMQFWESLAKDAKAAGVKMSELDEYIRAKGAADRNQRIRDLNGRENGSGISDADAARTVAEYENGPKGRAIQDLANRLWKLQHEGLMERVDAGLIDAQFAADLEAREKFHVPRHNRFDANGEFTGYETNAELAAAEWHKAEGRTTDAGNAIGWIMQEYCDAFSRGAENRVRQRLAQAVLASNGALGSATVVTPANEARLAELTKRNKNGNAQVVIVKQNGRKVALELNGTRGELVARAMTGRGMKELPPWVKKTLRVWASTATEWSPTFAVRNLFADMADVAFLNIGDHGLVKGLGRDASHIANMGRLAKDIWGYAQTGKTSNTWIKRFVDAGGLIGGMGREGFTDANEVAAYFGDKISLYEEPGLKKMMRSGKNGVKNVAKTLFGWVETLNKTTEMMNRLADFKTQVERGMSDRDAAAHARDITVDFNEKGEYTGVTNALYMFSNSTMGAAFRQVKALGRRGVQLTGTMLAIGFIEGLAEAMNGNEEEAEKAGTGTGKDLNEYTRANSLYFRVGGTTIRAPFHAGPLSVIKYTGNCAARYMAGLFNEKNSSKLSGKEAAANIGKEAAGIITHFLGLGDAGPNVVQTVTPTVGQWLVQLAQNKDYADRPIQKPKYEEAMPNSANGRRSTAEPYKWFAGAMNEWSGGNEGKKGKVDYAPEVYKTIAEAVGKNVLRDVTTGYETVKNVIGMFTGDADWDVRNIPVARDFVRKTGGNTQRYYEAANRYRENRYELRTMIPNWTAEERKAFVKKHPWAAAPEVDKMIQKIGELQKLEDGYRKADKRGKWVKAKEPPTEEQKEKWKAARLRYQAKFLEIAEKHGGEH